MAWHGYIFIKMDATLAAVFSKVEDGVGKFGTNPKYDGSRVKISYPNENPSQVTHWRPNNNSDGMMLEMVFPQAPTKTEIAGNIATETGIARATVETRITTFTVFAGDDWDTRRRAARAFIVANIADWDPT